VSDADEATRQRVSEEALHEFVRGQGEETRPIPSTSIAIPEGHVGVVESDDSFVADGYAVRVPAEIAQYLSRSGHGCLAVDDPWCARRLSEPVARRGFGRGKGSRRDCGLEARQEFAPEDPGEHPDGQEEVGPCADPSPSIEA